MATFLLAFLVIAASLCGLGMGLLIGRRPLSGGCGGLACGGCRDADRGACRRRQGMAP